MSRSIVDTEVIAAAAGDINRLAESIQSDVATLRGRLASLDGAWEGPAKAEFVRVLHDYQSRAGPDERGALRHRPPHLEGVGGLPRARERDPRPLRPLTRLTSASGTYAPGRRKTPRHLPDGSRGTPKGGSP